jgi:hypothetical protein
VSTWLVGAYAALTLGLAWALIGSGGWRRRVPFVVATPALAFGLWLGQPDASGWPSVNKVPKQAALVWARVDEPDTASGNRGRIYLWLDTGAPAPRAYELPYTRSLHEQVQKALKSVQHGKPIEVARVKRGRKPVRGQRSTQGNHAHQSAAEATSTLRFYPQPPVLLPPKTK